MPTSDESRRGAGPSAAPPDAPPKVSAYLRCSTKAQDLEGQRAAVLAWAEREGHSLQFFEDDAVSGKRADRKGIQHLLRAAEAGEVDLVAVTELSRIGRSIGLITRAVEQLCEAGARIVLVNSGTRLAYDTLEGRALVNALALAADVEWHLIRERTTRGRETIRRRGIRVGRKPVEVSARVLASLRQQGLSIREIARELKISRAT